MSKKTISLQTIMWIIFGGGGVLGVIAYLTTIIVNSYTIKKTFFDPTPTFPQPSQAPSPSSPNAEIPTPEKPLQSNTISSNKTSVNQIITAGESRSHPPTPKPSPEKMVRDYYSSIINRQYETAWRQQSEKFKTNKHEANKRRGYPDYNLTNFGNWWRNNVKSLTIDLVKLVNSDNEKPSVDVKYQYKDKTGKLVNEFLRLSLVWDSQNNNWFIDDSTRPSESDIAQKIAPSSSPSPKISIQTERVNFIPNDTEIQQDGSVYPNQKKRYLIHRTRGQKLAVKLLQGNVSFVVIDPLRQNLSDPTTKVGLKIEPPVRRDGDYAIEISSGTNSDYVVSFELASKDIKPPVSLSIVTPKLGVRSGETRSGLPPRSQPSPSPTVTSKPSPEQAVRDYWSKISDGEYQTAWNQQSAKFQNNQKLHPNGYASFREFCQGIDWVRTDKVTPIESDNQQTVVDVDFRYRKKTGRIVNMSLRLSLVWDAKVGNWLIDESKRK